MNVPDEMGMMLLKEQYNCAHFRILVIGRANAGKTTILEKVCGVAQGTKPIIYDEEGVELNHEPKHESRPEPKPEKIFAKVKHFLGKKAPPASSTNSVPTYTHLTPSIERGIHDIEHQITYPGSNFIFHDSQGFESGATDEMEIVWNFIEKKSAATEMAKQLHAIWYCIPMEGSRPLLSAELEFFSKGTKDVPLITIFTKFDAQIVQEYVKLNDIEGGTDRWNRARENAEKSFNETYLSKVLNTNYPPKAYVKLEDMHKVEKNCPELTQQTANTMDDATLLQLFISTQRNNVDLCVEAALQHTLNSKIEISLMDMVYIVATRFPHYWISGHNVVGDLTFCLNGLDKATLCQKLSSHSWGSKFGTMPDEFKLNGGVINRV